jgi:hypothetical protein
MKQKKTSKKKNYSMTSALALVALITSNQALTDEISTKKNDLKVSENPENNSSSITISIAAIQKIKEVNALIKYELKNDAEKRESFIKNPSKYLEGFGIKMPAESFPSSSLLKDFLDKHLPACNTEKSFDNEITGFESFGIGETEAIRYPIKPTPGSGLFPVEGTDGGLKFPNKKPRGIDPSVAIAVCAVVI